MSEVTAASTRGGTGTAVVMVLPLLSKPAHDAAVKLAGLLQGAGLRSERVVVDTGDAAPGAVRDAVTRLTAGGAPVDRLAVVAFGPAAGLAVDAGAGAARVGACAFVGARLERSARDRDRRCHGSPAPVEAGT